MIDLLTQYNPDIVLAMYFPPVLKMDKMFAWGDTTPLEVNENLLRDSSIEISGEEALAVLPIGRADVNGAQITLSFDYAGTPVNDSNSAVRLYGKLSDGSSYEKQLQVSEMDITLSENGMTRCFVTLSLPADLASLERIEFTANDGTISLPKMEYGARATAWCTAIEEQYGYGQNLISEEYDPDSILIDPAGNYNHIKLTGTLEPGATYRFSTSSIEILEGHSDGINIVLIDLDKEKRIRQWTLETASAINGAEWTFAVPKGETNAQVLIYAGMWGSAEGNSISIKDAAVIKIHDARK